MNTLLTAIFLAAIGSGQLSDDPELACSLTVKVVDAQGRERPYDVVSFRPLLGKSAQRGEELVKHFRGMAIAAVKCGTYDITLKPRDETVRGRGIDACRDGETRQTVSVNRAGGFLSVIQASEHCDDALIDYSDRGRGLQIKLLSLAGDPRSYWCSLHPTAEHWQHRQDALVSASGEFIFSNIEKGLYILAVQRSGEITALIPVEVPGERLRPRPLIVDLRPWLLDSSRRVRQLK